MTDESTEWRAPLFKIMKRDFDGGLHEGVRGALAAIEKVSGVASKRNLAPSLAQLKVGETLDAGGGVYCKRMHNTNAPGVTDPMKAARANPKT